MIPGNKIEFFENLAQIEYEGQYYDFHNDFDCEGIILNENHILTLEFKHSQDLYLVLFRFKEVYIENMSFFNTNDGGLTIDLIYRGRTVVNEKLIELSENDQAYFYVEFYDGQKIEFWAKQILIEHL